MRTVKVLAGRYEGTEERTTRRNGTRPKSLATPAGEVDLAIPRLREGSCFASLLSSRRRVDRALYAVIRQAWIDGVSTRKVDQLVRTLGNDTGISRSTVSRICGEIDEAVQEFLSRRIDHSWFPYLFLDATYLDVRHRGRVVSQALVVATEVSGEGRREILGMALGDAETTDFWTEFLRSLRDRGPKVATDADPPRCRPGHFRRARRSISLRLGAMYYFLPTQDYGSISEATLSSLDIVSDIDCIRLPEHVSSRRCVPRSTTGIDRITAQ